MPHALNFHNFRVAEKLVHDAIIADANPVCVLRTGQFFRTVW